MALVFRKICTKLLSRSVTCTICHLNTFLNRIELFTNGHTNTYEIVYPFISQVTFHEQSVI